MIGTYVAAFVVFGSLSFWFLWMLWVIIRMYTGRPERLAQIDWINNERYNRFTGKRHTRYAVRYEELKSIHQAVIQRRKEAK